MSFWSRLFGGLFGRRRKEDREPEPPRAPPPTQTSPPPPPVAPPPPVQASPPAAPPPPVQVSPPAAPIDLSRLVATTAARVGSSDFDAVARRLGVEAAAVRAVVQIESAGAGFGDGGRPLILFEPVIFSQLTGGRYDATHPNLSQSSPRAGGLPRTQAERWARLTEAYGLDPEAALKATSWGLFQIGGRDYALAGFSSVFAMVEDMAQSEARQLAAFEQLVRSRDLADELRNRDWASFARVYNGVAGSENYGRLMGEAYAALKRAEQGASFLEGLYAKDAARLTLDQLRASAERLGCEMAAIQAVVKVESFGAGFARDGRPIILYEPHVFSRMTQHRFDATHPHLSYRSWRKGNYPRTQEARWAQIKEAYALDPEAALGGASWGLFQILGENHAVCGFPTPSAFVADISQNEERQLMAFEAFVRSKGLVDELKNKDWDGFARVYNGPGQVPTYGRLLREAYAQFSATPVA